MPWERKRMLIWGKTYPELSRKYTETVCTGAVLMDEPGLIRIYPLDYRYLDEDQQPRKWSVISAEIREPKRDERPESRRINAGGIEVEGRLGTDNGWELRRKHMLREEHMLGGLEEMEARQRESGMSLGVIKPEILDVTLDRLSDDELREHKKKYAEITSQQELWEPGKKPMWLPKYKPRIRFRAPGDSKPYDRRCLDWEVIEGARHHFDKRDPEASFREMMFEKAFSDEHEPYLILGNIHRFPHTFVVVCVFYPKTQTQTSLF